MGSTCNADGGWFNEQVASNNYFLGTKENETNPFVFAAVVDKIGTFIYRIPAAQSDLIWPGLSRTTAACTLGPRPVQRPPNAGPPCDDSNPYCALFIPNFQAGAWGRASAGHQGGANQGCKVNGQQDGASTGGASWMTRDSGRGQRTAASAWCSTRRRQTRWRCRGTTRWSRGRWAGRETRSTMAPAVLLTRDIAPRDFPHIIQYVVSAF